MDDIKTKCYNILLEIDRICKLSNIKYFIYAGTLLGAIRHRGFIPWDDDIDVVMFRDDYRNFFQACKEYLDKDRFVLQSIDTDPFTCHPWMKLHDKNTAFISGIRRDGTIEGISIDIFPIDNAPNNFFIRKIRSSIVNSINFIYQWRFCYHNPNATRKMKLFQKIVSIIPPIDELKFKKRYEKYLQKYNHRLTLSVVYLSNRKYERKVISRDVFSSSVMLQFEDGFFPAPIGWDLVLRGLYGDNYMQLPPKEKRISDHGTCIIDLDHSWTEYKRGSNGYEKI